MVFTRYNELSPVWKKIVFCILNWRKPKKIIKLYQLVNMQIDKTLQNEGEKELEKVGEILASFLAQNWPLQEYKKNLIINTISNIEFYLEIELGKLEHFAGMDIELEKEMLCQSLKPFLFLN